MSIGRLPKPLADARDRSMENVALALDETELGERAIEEVRRLWALVRLGLGGYPEDIQAEVRRGFKEHLATVCRSYEIDCQDLENATPLSASIERVIEQREPLHTQAALTRQVRV